MLSLGSWTGARVAVIAVAWPVVVLGYLAWRLARVAAGTDVGAFSVDTVKGLVVLLGPPVLLMVAWLVARATNP